MEEKRLYYKVPHRAVKPKEQGGSNLHVIGLIDSSGSMSSWWKWIAEFWNSDAIPKENLRTITFDTRPRHVPSNVLSTRIQDHGGGGTAIPEAVAELEKVIETIPIGESITAIFISDGQDSYANTLEARMKKLKGNVERRPINFICLGIQSGFPTFISMRLRELFHQGDDNIPALYLIEYVSEKAFFNKFEGMRQYFYSAGSVKLDPAVMVYPWDESVIDEAYEGSWVICKSDSIAIDGGEPVKIEKLELNVEDAVEIFRGWVQKLQMISLTSPEDARNGAKIAVHEMRYAIAELNKRYDTDVRTVTEEQAAATPQFGLRAKLNYIWRYGSKIDWFFTEVENLANGVVPKNTSEFDAAKRMNIGTITGKHQQKALALKNLTQHEFTLIKQEFATVLQANKAKAAEVLAESTKRDNKAFVTSNVEIFANINDFLTGLEYCKNSYDFFETLPFTGLAAKVKRNEGYMENVRLVETKGVYFNADRLNISVLSNSTNQWNVPMQAGDERVEMNAILPILRIAHADFLRPLLKTRLMKLIFSFLVTTNYDAIYEDAYLNTLASTLLLAYQQQSLPIREELTNLVYESLFVLFENDKAFQIVQDNLSADPSSVVLEFKDRDDILFLHLFYAQKSKRLDEDSLQEAGRRARMLYFSTLVQKVGLYSLVKPDFESIGVDAVVNSMKSVIDTFFSLSEFRKGFIEQFARFAKEAATKKLEVTKKFLSDTDIAKVNVSLLEALLMQKPYASLTAEEQDAIQLEYIVQIAHVAKYPGVLASAFSSPVEKDVSSIKEQVVLSLDEAALKKVKVFNEVFLKLEKIYVDLYVKRHWNVQPIPKEALIKHCEEKGVVFDTLQLDEASLLCKNACLCPECPFFLQTNAKFNRHLGGWQGKMPLGFHRFVKARANQPAAKLYTLALTKWKGFPAAFNVTEEFARDYIQRTLNTYLADAPIVHDTATG